MISGGLGGQAASADLYHWDGGVGDNSFTNPENWNHSDNNTDGLPGPSDDASINGPAPAGYTMDLSSTAHIDELFVGTLQTGSLNVLSGASLIIDTGINLGTSSNGSRGYINQYAGSTVTASSLLTGRYTVGRQCYYNLFGGTFSIDDNVTLGRHGLGHFTQAGGDVTIGGDLNLVTTINGVGPHSNTEGLYAVSGGTLEVAGDVLNGAWSSDNSASGRAISTFRVIGSSATISIGGNYTTAIEDTVSLNGDDGLRLPRLEVSLDHGGVSKINLTGTGTATLHGTLSAGFQAGAALTTTDTVNLLEANARQHYRLVRHQPERQSVGDAFRDRGERNPGCPDPVLSARRRQRIADAGGDAPVGKLCRSDRGMRDHRGAGAGRVRSVHRRRHGRIHGDGGSYCSFSTRTACWRMSRTWRSTM